MSSANTSFCRINRRKYSGGEAIRNAGSPPGRQSTVNPANPGLVYLIQRFRDSSCLTSCSAPPCRSGPGQLAGRIKPSPSAHAASLCHCQSMSRSTASDPSERTLLLRKASAASSGLCGWLPAFAVLWLRLSSVIFSRRSQLGPSSKLKGQRGYCCLAPLALS